MVLPMVSFLFQIFETSRLCTSIFRGKKYVNAKCVIVHRFLRFIFRDRSVLSNMLLQSMAPQRLLDRVLD